MRLVISAGEALERSRQIQVNGRDYTLAEYVGAAPERGIYVEGNEHNDNGLPQGFLVIQPPGAVTPAHFHEPNQFQVFVEGNARIGARPAMPLTVQYANGHTPYGPIVAFDEGVKYFTLRQHWDPGAKYVPASLAKLIKGNQRTRIRSGIGRDGGDQHGSATTPQVEIVFEKEPDGLAGWLYRLGSGQSCSLEDPADGGGQYIVVTGGALVCDGTEFPRHSICFVSPDEPAFKAVASDAGLEFLILQFPKVAQH